MELKQNKGSNVPKNFNKLLIVPYGIETYFTCNNFTNIS